MEFGEWVSRDNGLERAVVPFLNKIKAAVLGSMRVEDGFLSFSFPQDYEALIAPAPVSRPVLQAAHTERPGPGLSEVSLPGRKGPDAYKRVADLLPWDQKTGSLFAAGLNKNIRRVSKQMGLLFEVEAFLYLTGGAGLKPALFTVSPEEAAQTSRQYYEEIAKMPGIRGTAFPELLLQFIRVHAQGPPVGMAHLMHQKALKLLKCKVDTVEYKGGQQAAGKLGRDTADIRIGCDDFMPGQRSDIGFSMKFTSEPRVHVFSMTARRALHILGLGKVDVSDMLAEVESLSGRERNLALVGHMAALAGQTFEGSPVRFVWLLERLVLGKADTLPAVRQYDTGRGEASWSPAYRADFDTSQRRGRKLQAREDAVVTAGGNNTYAWINYKLPKGMGGTSHGTTIYFEPKGDGGVDVKVTNLGALGGRGY